MEWGERTHRELLKHLNWITSVEVDSVMVAIPYLLELTKKQVSISLRNKIAYRDALTAIIVRKQLPEQWELIAMKQANMYSDLKIA